MYKILKGNSISSKLCENISEKLFCWNSGLLKRLRVMSFQKCKRHCNQKLFYWIFPEFEVCIAAMGID